MMVVTGKGLETNPFELSPRGMHMLSCRSPQHLCKNQPAFEDAGMDPHVKYFPVGSDLVVDGGSKLQSGVDNLLYIKKPQVLISKANTDPKHAPIAPAQTKLGLDVVYPWFLSKVLKKRGTKQVVIKQEAYYDSIHLTMLESRTFPGIL